MPSRPKKRGLALIGWGKKCGMHQTNAADPPNDVIDIIYKSEACDGLSVIE
jgi:hypothetical protein